MKNTQILLKFIKKSSRNYYPHVFKLVLKFCLSFLISSKDDVLIDTQTTLAAKPNLPLVLVTGVLFVPGCSSLHQGQWFKAGFYSIKVEQIH